jgi:hypothetical protein
MINIFKDTIHLPSLLKNVFSSVSFILYLFLSFSSSSDEELLLEVCRVRFSYKYLLNEHGSIPTEH